MTYANDLASSLSSSLSSLTPRLIEEATDKPSSSPSSSSSTSSAYQLIGTTDNGNKQTQDLTTVHDRTSQLRSILSKLHPSHSNSSNELVSLLDQAFPSFQGLDSKPITAQVDSIEHVTIAHLTIAAYGLVLRRLMDQASRLGEEDDWWAQRETDVWKQGFYLLQSTPSRVISLSATLVSRLRDLTIASLHDSQPPPSYLSWSTYQTALPRSLLVAAIFPHLAASTSTSSPADDFASLDADSALDTTNVTATKAGVSFSDATRLARKTTRSLFFLTLSPLALTRQEISQRRKLIRFAREDLAKRIGELTLAPQPFTEAETESRSDSEKKEGNTANDRRMRYTLPALLTTTNQEPANLDSLKSATWATLVHLSSALASSSRPSTLADQADRPPTTASDYAHALHYLLTKTLLDHTKSIEDQLKPLSKPGFLTRAWPYFLAVPLVSFGIGRTIYKSRDNLYKYTQDAIDTVKRFVIDWVVEPVRGIFETVRGEGGMSLTGKETLKSDLDSLERMVIDFGRDEYKLSDVQLADLREKVRAGDLTPVLKAFEHDLKSPLKSAITGSLVRTLLIQVQKVKVDVALAMDGIEKMLRSQQLTFGFVGVAPSILVLFAFTNWVRSFTRSDGSSKKKRKEWGKRCWLSIRQLDLLLAPPRDLLKNKASSNSNKDEEQDQFEQEKITQGLVLLCLANLRNYAKRGVFPSKDTQLRQAFLEDVRAIEDEGARADADKRAKMVERMWRWGAALGWENIA